MLAFEHLESACSETLAAMEDEPSLRENVFAETDTVRSLPQWSFDSQMLLVPPEKSANWRHRIAWLIEITVHGALNSTTAAKVVGSAFDDQDIRVRGAAWIIANDAWQLQTSHDMFHAVSREFETRFEPSWQEVAAVVKDWLRGLWIHVKTIRMTRKYLEGESDAVRHFAGDDYALLRHEASAAELFLTNSNGARRLAAVMLLRRRSNNGDSVREKILALSKNDPEPAVRQAAVVATVAFFQKTRDGRVMRTLAEIVMNDSEEAEVRAHAYNGLFVVGDRPGLEYPLVKSKGDCSAALEMIDSNFVLSCIREAAME